MSFLIHFIKDYYLIDFDFRTRYFTNGQLKLEPDSSIARYVKRNCRPLFEHLRSNSIEDRELFDLIHLMLEYDPSKRITLKTALWHRFFERLPVEQKPHISENQYEFWQKWR